MTTLASPCLKRHHSPRLSLGKGWSCPDCEAGAQVSDQHRALSAALDARDRGEVVRPIRRESKIPAAERELFVAAIRQVARGGLVRQNDVRPLVRGRIFHKHIGSLWTWAVASGLLEQIEREQSSDVASRNTHHNSGVYRLKRTA